ncbi:MAG: hypothetical protein IJN88_07345 [Clostridia bacterium]|nr:hypothetical protein [Clostridia bacterium]
MKKILSRIFLGLLVIIVVVGGTAAYMLFHNPDEPVDISVTTQPTMVDSSGKSHLVVVDGNGTSYAVVTDADGNRYAAEYNGNEIGSTVGQVNDQIALDDLPSESASGPQVVVTNNPNDYMGDVGTTVPVVTTTPSTQPTTNTAPDVSTTVATPAEPGPYDLIPYRIEKYEKIFASGTYLMEITTNDPDLGDTPITMAIKNGNMYINTTIEGMKCDMIFDNPSDTMYLIFTDWKKYCKLPEDLMGEDFDMSSMMADFGMNDVGEVTVSKADINGQELIMESYTSSVDGSTVNYYFNGDQMVRRDNISKNGAVDSIYVSKFLSDVPDTYFQIPEGYGYLNLSWIGALM